MRLLTFSIVALLCLNTSACVLHSRETVQGEPESIAVTQIPTCSAAMLEPTVFDAVNSVIGRNQISGWNHIDTSEPEFDGLKLSEAAYRITPEHFSTSDHCSSFKTYKTTLAVKLSDWTRQHANGIEVSVDSASGLTGAALSGHMFSDVEAIIMDFKLDATRTQLFTSQQLSELYGAWLSEEQLLALDRGAINLGITLFAEGALDQATRSLSAVRIIELDASRMSEGWFRLRVPLSELNYFYEQQYSREPADQITAASQKIVGLRLTAETSQGKQLRNLLGDAWRPQIPEAYKEIGLELSRLALVAQ